MMRRPNHHEKVGPFMDAVRQKNNRAILRTDLIIGWPTETEEELMHSLEFAVKYFDEIAIYSIELSPDLPAWEFHELAFDEEEMNRRLSFARKFIEDHGIVAHGGQQEDDRMKEIEDKREAMRMARSV
jgi:tRNA A37 methylthiotransferase MiaB